MTGSRPQDGFARLGAAINRELDRIERVVEEARDGLEQFAEKRPSLLELRGLGDVVHDFYTSVERVFERVSVEFDGGRPRGPAWHQELLESMTLEIPDRRPPVVAVQTARQLEEMMRFRHLFRNVYGFELEWGRVRPLLERMPALWGAVHAELNGFVRFLAEAARPD